MAAICLLLYMHYADARGCNGGDKLDRVLLELYRWPFSMQSGNVISGLERSCEEFLFARSRHPRSDRRVWLTPTKRYYCISPMHRERGYMEEKEGRNIAA